MLNRANTLVNVGHGEDLPSRSPFTQSDYTDIQSNYTDTQHSIANTQSDYPDSETWAKSYLRSSLVNHEQSSFTDRKNSLVNGARKFVIPLEKLQEEYINEEMRIWNRKGGKFLTRLYGNNEEFREEIIKFVRVEKELDLELILDKRCKTNTLNTLGKKYLAECITSKDNTKDLIEIMAKYYQRNN